jgi:hypothetical protein
MKFEELREKYNKFIYEKYEINDTWDWWDITYFFSIPWLTEFRPTIQIDKKNIKNQNIDKDFVNYLVFHIGLVELISYWKCCCSKNVEIKAWYIDEDQIKWFKKMYFYGLGEFFYTNGIEVNEENFMNMQCHLEMESVILNETKWSEESIKVNKDSSLRSEWQFEWNLITIWWWKDSNVTLELLKWMDNDTFILNPNDVTLECSKIAGYDNPRIMKRTLDPQIVELNKQWFLNGHTPFNALLAFLTYLVAYLGNKKYIVLSNESSANESNVRWLKVNHQYSKSFEFENDFNQYTEKYFWVWIKYFSFLRPLLEIQIAKLFSQFEQYHQVFKSCNVWSKSKPRKWCCNCPKCLFVYIILSPFLYKEKLVNIFGENLFENKNLLQTFIDLTWNSENKPFECVGTYDEVNYAIALVIKKLNWNLPYLLQYYVDHFKVKDYDLLNYFNKENNLDPEFLDVLKKYL